MHVLGVSAPDAEAGQEPSESGRKQARANLVLRWEWRPGRTLYGVWQQNREDERAIRDRAGIGSLFRSFSSDGDNILAIKASVWIGR